MAGFRIFARISRYIPIKIMHIVCPMPPAHLNAITAMNNHIAKKAVWANESCKRCFPFVHWHSIDYNSGVYMKTAVYYTDSLRTILNCMHWASALVSHSPFGSDLRNILCGSHATTDNSIACHAERARYVPCATKS